MINSVYFSRIWKQTIERKQKDAVITFKDGKHAAMFAEKYNRQVNFRLKFYTGTFSFQCNVDDMF